MISQDQIRENLDEVAERITRAAARAGRSVADIRLVVVTKAHSIEIVRSAIGAGARILGENYADEGLEKIRAIGNIPGIEWHMIGHVQSRKAPDVALNYSLIHSVDSYKLAEKINRVATIALARQDILLQINVSGEESKYGIPCWNDDQFNELTAETRRIADLPNVKVCGFMTIPPLSEQADSVRPFFQRLRKIRDQLAREIKNMDFVELSMGMSADFEIAVEEGATLVRVGTAILGERTA